MKKVISAGSIVLDLTPEFPDIKVKRQLGTHHLKEHIGETPLKVLCVHGKYDNIVPYAGAMRFVRKINAEAKLSGAGRRAAMLEIVDPKYQHFRLCAGLWRESSSASPILRHVMGWLENV